jgi:hypothetical protein
MSDVKLVNDGMAILSLRDSDFDAYSAYGEVIDNSIQAKANWVKIHFEYEMQKQKGKKKPYCAIIQIAFGDDGIGMPPEILHRCMQLGYSSRYNDRTGIGRFGVGMTLGAINQCKRVDIYSKEQGKDWYYTYVDIDEIVSEPPTQDAIPIPIVKKPPEIFTSITNEKCGTVVVWKKYDRQPDTAEKMEPKMRSWFGRTFRKFLWNDGFDIYINGSSVHAIDPLYLNKNKNEFPDDPPSIVYEPIELKWPVSKLDNLENAPDYSTIIITLSKLNKFHYPRRLSGSSSDNSARGIHENKGPGNEGISILRNNREVFYGHIPYWPKKAFLQMDRWWGCEISFDAVLDRSFTVKNIKRGAVPVKQLKEQIAELIEPTRKQVIKDVQEYWDEVDKEENKKRKDGTTKTDHDEVERIVSRTPTDKSAIDKGKNIDKEAKKIVDELMGDKSEEDKAKWIAKFKDQPFTILDDSWKGPIFLEASHLGGSDVLKYNHQHPFFKTIYSIIKELEKKQEGNESALFLKQLIDILLISYSKAEAKFEADQKLPAEDFVEYLKNNWGMYLQNYVKTWKKEKGYE